MWLEYEHAAGIGKSFGQIIDALSALLLVKTLVDLKVAAVVNEKTEFGPSSQRALQPCGISGILRGPRRSDIDHGLGVQRSKVGDAAKESDEFGIETVTRVVDDSH